MEIYRLRGPAGGPIVVVTRPWKDLTSAQVRDLHAACTSVSQTESTHLLRVPIEKRLLGAYLGRSAAHYDQFWAFVDPEICTDTPWKAEHLAPPRYLLCGARQSESICLRDLLTEHYSAHFTIAAGQVADIQGIEDRVRGYLARLRTDAEE